MMTRLWMTFLCLGSLMAQEAAGTIPSREEIAGQIRKAWRSIDSLRVAYNAPDDAPGRPRGHYLHTTLLFKGSDDMGLDFAHGWETQDWATDYGRHRSFIRGRRYQVHWPGRLAYEERQLGADEVPERIALQSWFRACGYWPEGAPCRPPEPLGVPVSVLAILEDPRFVLSASQVADGGATSIALEWPGRACIVLDPRRAFAVKSVRWQDMEGFARGNLRVLDYLAIEGGPWLPTSFAVEAVERGVTEDRKGNYRVDGVDYSVNRLSDGDFIYVPEPGSLRISRRIPDDSQQMVPGGLDFLMRTADELARRFSHAAGGNRGVWMVPACAIVALAALGWTLRAMTARRVAAATRG